MALPAGTRALDILKAESAISTPRKRKLRFASGNELEFYVTPITVAQRREAVKAAGSEEQVDVNLQLLVMKARDENGKPLFVPAEIVELRRVVSAGILADLINSMYSLEDTPEDDTEPAPDFTPKPSPRPSDKTAS